MHESGEPGYLVDFQQPCVNHTRSLVDPHSIRTRFAKRKPKQVMPPLDGTDRSEVPAPSTPWRRRPLWLRRELTEREVQVLRLIATGSTRATAAAELGLAPSTVRRHAARIFAVLGARNAAHAVAIAHSAGVFGSCRTMPVGGPVTRRERQVLRGIAAGLTAAQLGSVLVLSPETVKSHISRLYRKLGVCTRPHAVDAAFRCGLL
jgi:DNA-binding NarL/FixJ family response regulator